MQGTSLMLGAGMLMVLAQAAPGLPLPEFAGLGASGATIGVLIWLLRSEKAEKAADRKEFLDSLKANTSSLDKNTESVDRLIDSVERRREGGR